jgi:hypothetical protein
MTRPALLAALLALAATAPAAQAAQYTTRSGPERAEPSFDVTYEGSGSYSTAFHATPPNPDGDPDTNDAHDKSRQAWDLTFRRTLRIPDCDAPTIGARPCEAVKGLTGARGATTMAGSVNHKHVDGLDRRFDRTVRCRLRKETSAKTKVTAAIDVRYLPEPDAFGVTARNPVTTAIDLFPSQCPRQGDSIDRVLDFYAMPGFSFADSYGPERFYSSAEVVVPAAVFHRSVKIKIPLANTRAGRPPKACAVPNPSFERCRTSGTWAGVLVLRVREP